MARVLLREASEPHTPDGAKYIPMRFFNSTTLSTHDPVTHQEPEGAGSLNCVHVILKRCERRHGPTTSVARSV